MPTTPEGFSRRHDRLRADLGEQGRRVRTLVEDVFEALFEVDVDRARRAVSFDDAIDRVDVEIERAAVDLLTDVAESPCALSPNQIRSMLVVVKANNELERIADAGVDIAERIAAGRLDEELPATLQVMANSIIGVVRDAVRCLDAADADLARVVLASEDTIEQFRQGILRDAEEQLASGSVSVDFAFALHSVVNRCLVMADHATNIAEQVIYASTGAIVRHTDKGWVDVPLAADEQN